jgi:hypothetical protein
VTVVTDRVLDDLDRLAFRLRRLIRTEYPALARQGFTLADLEERLLPSRDARREMADSGGNAWEVAMLRLVSGEREYLEADAELRASACRALTLPSPSLGHVRAWATAPIRLGPGMTPAEQVPALHDPSGMRTPWGEQATGGAMGAHTAGIATRASACRYCHGRLPEQRRVTFCPHCGHDLTKRQCPACCTELDVTWRFCVTCGRGTDLPDRADRPAPPGAAR